MKSHEIRTPFRFGALPHSVLDLANELSGTASKLLLFLARRTLSFRRGSIVMSFRELSRALGVSWRTIANAAKQLSKEGHILREKIHGGGAYRWWVPLKADEIVGEPGGDFKVRGMHTPCNLDHIPHEKAIISPMQERSWEQTFDKPASRVGKTKVKTCARPVEKSGLKKDLLKETCIKEIQHQDKVALESLNSQSTESQVASCSDDEPLHKFCLRGLKSYGVRQRVARQLCREYDHEMIQRALKSVAQRSGIKNVAGYLVAAIKDGGYENKASRPEGKKNGHQGSGGRSNYAHLTDHNVQSDCHRNVKAAGDAPIGYRTVEETRAEAEELETERLEREELYRKENRSLGERFRELSDDVKVALKKLSAQCLEKLVPSTERREEMLQDVAFKRIANRAVLEQFFDWVERGFSEEQALRRVSLSGV